MVESFAAPQGIPGSRADDATWEAQLARLAAYKEAHGDCNVPSRWDENPRLGKWIRKQRDCKRQLDRGEPGRGMTAERAAKLDALGFAWTGEIRPSQAQDLQATWDAQLAKLETVRAAQGALKCPWRFP